MKSFQSLLVSGSLSNPERTFQGDVRAFSGKVDAGFSAENAITQEELERFPIQSNRKTL
jgi:hypothetical protein